MNLVILDPFTLHQQVFRNDIFAMDARTHKDEKKTSRHDGTDNLFSGFMADFIERIGVLCHVIRGRYRDPEGNYKGFIPAHGAGWYMYMYQQSN